MAIILPDGRIKVEKGDTLSGIYGANWRTLSGYTGDPTKLQVGTILPAKPGGSVSAPTITNPYDTTKFAGFRPRGEYESMDDYLKAKRAWEISSNGSSSVVLPGDTGDTGGNGGDTGDTGGGGTGNTGTSATGNTQLDGLLKGLQDWFEKIQAQGNITNPNIEITPEIVQSFVDLAKKDIDPYYVSYMDVIGKEVSSNLKTLQKQYDLSKQDRLSKFQSDLATQRENEATGGTIFSGGRMQRANALKSANERSLSSLENTALSNASDLGATAEKDIGSTNLSSLSIPKIQTGSLNLMGEGQYVPIEDRSLYNLMGGVSGAKPKEWATASQNYKDYLETKYRADQARTLPFYQ